MSTPFAGPTMTSLRFSPRWRAITFSKKARLTLPIGYFRGVVWSVNGRGLLRIPWLKTSSRSLRRHDPDQVPRVYPSRGILSALLGSPGGRCVVPYIKLGRRECRPWRNSRRTLMVPFEPHRTRRFHEAFRQVFEMWRRGDADAALSARQLGGLVSRRCAS